MTAEEFSMLVATKVEDGSGGGAGPRAVTGSTRTKADLFLDEVQVCCCRYLLESEGGHTILISSEYTHSQSHTFSHTLTRPLRTHSHRDTYTRAHTHTHARTLTPVLTLTLPTLIPHPLDPISKHCLPLTYTHSHGHYRLFTLTSTCRCTLKAFTGMPCRRAV
jgi:hypothetical protein